MNRQMNPSTKASAVLRVLSEGPATTGEIAASLSMPIRLARAHLSKLRRRKIGRERSIPYGSRQETLEDCGGGMSKHSPGPWAYTEHSWSDTSICDDNGRQLALISIEGEATEETQDALSEEALGNARLMAAAPDLLIALKAVVSVADRNTDEFILARAAIARADGDQP